MRARGSFSNNSRRYQYGSHPFALAVSIKLYNSALAAAARALPGEQPVLAADHTNGRIACSQELLSGVSCG